MSNATTRANAPGSPTTRRTLLATLAGTGAALSLPMVAKAAEVATISETDAAHPDAALLALRPRAKAVQARLDGSCDRLGTADLLRFRSQILPGYGGSRSRTRRRGRGLGRVARRDRGGAGSTLAGLRFKATWAPGLWNDTDVMQAPVKDIVAMAGAST